MTPGPKNYGSDSSLKSSKDFSSDVILADGLYFKFNNQFNSDIEDHLSLLYKQGIEARAKEVNEEAEKKSVSEIFEFNDNIQLNENMPGISMSFLDRLFHQLTRPSASTLDDYSDEEFTEIDDSEVTTISNNNTDLVNSRDDKNKSTYDIPFIRTMQSFITDLREEADVILGTLDEDTFINRRSRRAKSLVPVNNNDTTFVSQTFF
jgi:hypothetical protein